MYNNVFDLSFQQYIIVWHIEIFTNAILSCYNDFQIEFIFCLVLQDINFLGIILL